MNSNTVNGSINLFLLVIILFYYISVTESSIPLDEGYYWKEYHGKVPHDALPGGYESSGKTTYIGQSAKAQYMVVGEIRSEQEQLFLELGGPHVTKTNVKILCTEHPEMYKWVKTSIADMKNLRSDTFVIGGFEDGFPLIVARVKDEGDTVVGKIHHNAEGPTGLWIAHNGINVGYKEGFEVLTYNPKASKKDLSNIKTVNVNIYN